MSSALRFRTEILYDLLGKTDGLAVVVTRLRTGRPRNRGSIAHKGKNGLLFCKPPRPVLLATKPPIQWVPLDFSAGVKQPGREALISTSAETTNEWS